MGGGASLEADPAGASKTGFGSTNTGAGTGAGGTSMIRGGGGATRAGACATTTDASGTCVGVTFAARFTFAAFATFPADAAFVAAFVAVFAVVFAAAFAVVFVGVFCATGFLAAAARLVAVPAAFATFAVFAVFATFATFVVFFAAAGAFAPAAGALVDLSVEPVFDAEVFFAAIRDLSRRSQLALPRCRCGVEATRLMPRPACGRTRGCVSQDACTGTSPALGRTSPSTDFIPADRPTRPSLGRTGRDDPARFRAQ